MTSTKLSILLVVLLCAAALLYVATRGPVGGPTAVALDPTPRSVTLSGTYVCLPHIDASGPQTEECAFGLKTDTGDYYAVNFGQSADAMQQFQHGAHITADGFVVIKEALSTDQWAKYEMKGIFTITALKAATDYKDAAYVIEGKRVQLVHGIATTEAAPGAASQIVTRYFGNELKTDLDGDGREDIAFVLTQETGGSGVFFYAVVALNTDHGYVGSDGYFLGDRIAPQSTNVSQNPRHKDVVVFNYADRAPGEPMSARPSVGKSVYLKLDPANMQWGIVEPGFEGEAR